MGLILFKSCVQFSESVAALDLYKNVTEETVWGRFVLLKPGAGIFSSVNNTCTRNSLTSQRFQGSKKNQFGGVRLSQYPFLEQVERTHCVYGTCSLVPFAVNNQSAAVPSYFNLPRSDFIEY